MIDLELPVYICTLVLDVFAHKTQRQQNKQHDSQSHPNAQWNNGSLRLAAIPYEEIETTAQTDNNTKHHNDNEEIEQLFPGRDTAS